MNNRQYRARVNIVFVGGCERETVVGEWFDTEDEAWTDGRILLARKQSEGHFAPPGETNLLKNRLKLEVVSEERSGNPQFLHPPFLPIVFKLSPGDHLLRAMRIGRPHLALEDAVTDRIQLQKEAQAGESHPCANGKPAQSNVFSQICFYGSEEEAQDAHNFWKKIAAR